MLQRPRGAARALRPRRAPPHRSPATPQTRACQTRDRVRSWRRDRSRRPAPVAAAGASRAPAARPAADSAALHAQPAPVPGAPAQAQAETQACRSSRKRRPWPTPQPRVPAASAERAPVSARAPTPPSPARLAASYLAAARTCRAARNRVSRSFALERAAARLPRTTAFAAFTGSSRALASPGYTFARAPAFASVGTALGDRLALAALAAPGGDSAGAAQRLRLAAASLPARERALPAALAEHGVRHVEPGGGPAGSGLSCACRRARHGYRKQTFHQSGGLFRR